MEGGLLPLAYFLLLMRRVGRVGITTTIAIATKYAAVVGRVGITTTIAALFLLLLYYLWPPSILDPFDIC